MGIDMALNENFIELLEKLYGNDDLILKEQLSRYNCLFEIFVDHFPDTDLFLFSTPGRTEIGGNHTDHNLGRVIAASINLDSIAVISKSEENKIILYSDSYAEPFEIEINNLNKIKVEEGTTHSLIRGIASRFVELGYNIGGFSGVITSDVLPGSGLSSSASVEVLLASIFNTLFNDGMICNEELAKIGQWAENNYFGKPCGLMDQLACAVGGIISVDFINSEKPEIEKIDFDFGTQGYRLLIVDTCGNHEDLTEDYASIPKEMKSVAKFYGKSVCRELSNDLLFSKISEARKAVGDRALLRAYHFLQENDRVKEQVNSLKEKDFSKFLHLVNESGNSSFKWLQNIYSMKNVKEQGMTLALALTESFIRKIGNGACRVHGGGFAGTIQVFLDENFVSKYKNIIDSVFGEGKVQVLNIRSKGTICLNNYPIPDC